MNIPLERAYQEACTALGEAVVMQRLLAAELARAHNGPDDPSTERPAEEAPVRPGGARAGA
jgi:hypothetical protein